MSCMLTTVRFLPWWRCSILVHSEDTHGNPPARFPPAPQLRPTDPADDKVYIHNAALPALHCSLPACLPLYLTETKLPLLPFSLLFSVFPQALKILAFSQNPRLLVASVLSTLPVSLNLATCADSPDAASLSSSLPSRYIRSPPALCFLSLAHTLRGSSSHTHSTVCLPPSPPRLQALSFLRIFLSSVCLCFYLFLSHSVCHCVSP